MGLQFLILVMRVVYSKQQAIDLRISVRVLREERGGEEENGREKEGREKEKKRGNERLNDTKTNAYIVS